MNQLGLTEVILLYSKSKFEARHHFYRYKAHRLQWSVEWLKYSKAGHSRQWLHG